MEADILKSLKFELGGPTVKTFLRHVCIESSSSSSCFFFLPSFAFPSMLAHCMLYLCLQTIL